MHNEIACECGSVGRMTFPIAVWLTIRKKGASAQTTIQQKYVLRLILIGIYCALNVRQRAMSVSPRYRFSCQSAATVKKRKLFCVASRIASISPLMLGLSDMVTFSSIAIQRNEVCRRFRHRPRNLLEVSNNATFGSTTACLDSLIPNATATLRLSV